MLKISPNTIFAQWLVMHSVQKYCSNFFPPVWPFPGFFSPWHYQHALGGVIHALGMLKVLGLCSPDLSRVCGLKQFIHIYIYNSKNYYFNNFSKKMKMQKRMCLHLLYTSISFIVILTFFFSHFQSEEKNFNFKDLFNYYSTFHKSKNNSPDTEFVMVWKKVYFWNFQHFWKII